MKNVILFTSSPSPSPHSTLHTTLSPLSGNISLFTRHIASSSYFILFLFNFYFILYFTHSLFQSTQDDTEALVIGVNGSTRLLKLYVLAERGRRGESRRVEEGRGGSRRVEESRRESGRVDERRELFYSMIPRC